MEGRRRGYERIERIETENGVLWNLRFVDGNGVY